MNILLISPYFRPMVGGVETHLDDLCSFFNKQRHNVYIRTYKALGVSMSNRGKTDEKNGNINIHRLWWPNFSLIFKLESYPILKFLYIFSGLFFDCLSFLLKNRKSIDVIQSHGFIAAAIAVILGKLFHKRVVINTHVGFNLSQGFMTQVIKWTLRSANKVLVLTIGVKKSLVEIGIPENKVEIYHYWVDQKIFNKQQNAKRQTGWDKKFVVLFVGRLIDVKGVWTIFDLAKELKDITFTIIGSGPLDNQLKQESRKYPNINFLGKVNNKELPVYYSGADVLLIPSRVIKQEYEEGIPRVMIEAILCSLPVISTRAGGIPDVFSSDIGVLVEDNKKAFYQIISRLLSDRKRLESMAKNCRPFALDNFSIRNALIIEKSLI